MLDFRLVFLASFGLIAHASAAPDHLGKIPWVKDLEEGQRRAKAERKLVMLVFSADW